MKIKRIERGLKLSTFECELCNKEVKVEDIWTVEGEEYRIYICSNCLVKEVERES